MSSGRRLPIALDPRLAWVGLGVLSIVLGLRYILTEPLIFQPGGWFALDGRRVLDAASAWRAGSDPYGVTGFVYSPVAVVLAAPLTLVSGAVAILGWIAASAVVAGVLVARTLEGQPLWARALGVAGVLLYVPCIADLVLANVTVMLVAATWVACRGTSVRSGVWLGLLGVAFPKPLLVPILVWLIVRRRSAALGAIVSGLAAMAVTTVLTGTDAWTSFVTVLRDGGGISLDFVGNYGLSKLAPPLAVPAALVGIALFAWLLVQRDPDRSFQGALALGPFAAPYTGIYAALPMLLAVPALARSNRAGAIVLCGLALVTAPWALPGAALLLGLAVAGSGRVVPLRAQPRERPLDRAV